ncbi:hypothetical protein NFI96_013722 [Prochilodus magdalenae]|nr:hypothetical protein NFI96_013722 [Prochilodus magdalenae]
MIHHPHHTCSVVVLWGSCPLKNRVIQYTEKQMDYSLDLYTYRVSCRKSRHDRYAAQYSDMTIPLTGALQCHPSPTLPTAGIVFELFSEVYIPVLHLERRHSSSSQDGKHAQQDDLIQFYRCFRALLMCSTPERGSSYKNSSKGTKIARTTRRANGPHATFMVVTAGQPTGYAADSIRPKPDSEDEGRSPAAGPSPGTLKPTVSLVAYYNG